MQQFMKSILLLCMSSVVMAYEHIYFESAEDIDIVLRDYYGGYSGYGNYGGYGGYGD